MEIYLCFSAQFCGTIEKMIHTERDLFDCEIRDLFLSEFGIKFDENCFYKIIE